MDYSDFLWFIEERESIRLKKEAGLPPPWTDDLILHHHRFCNVDRIHDRGTIRLLDFVEGMTDWEKVFYTTLYRAGLSSSRLLESLSGIWMHDYRNLLFLDMKIVDGRKPYQVFLRSGQSVNDFLSIISTAVAKTLYEVLLDWNNMSILDASNEIADIFLNRYHKRMVFISTEIAKDLSYFFSDKIDPESECRMNIGAKMALKKLPGRIHKDKIEILLHKTNLNYSSLEHSLCDWGKYCRYKRYYEEHGELRQGNRYR